MPTYTLHEDPTSMNCYKIRLVASLVSQPLRLVSYNILQGDTRTPSFLSTVSPWGRIPVLEIDAHAFLPESNAACYYLADFPGSKLVPENRFERAQMMRWMFWEQNEHEPAVASMRFWTRYVGIENLDEARRAQVGARREQGGKVLQRMEDHLGQSESGWLVGGGVTLADLVLYAYTHVAGEGGFEMDTFPRIGEWCRRVEGLDGYVSAF